jgi:hypothetical protein
MNKGLYFTIIEIKIDWLDSYNKSIDNLSK